MTKILYTAHGTAIHGGRNGGEARTDDGKVAVKLSVPKAMGGDDGPGTNPEQLFSIGYAACFLGAMQSAARRLNKKLPEGAEVSADVSFADREDKIGYTIVPVLTAAVPGWSQPEIEQLMSLAHDICPYSNLIRFAHEVELKAELKAA
jgi:osmotically inducible protein OsmC